MKKNTAALSVFLLAASCFIIASSTSDKTPKSVPMRSAAYDMRESGETGTVEDPGGETTEEPVPEVESGTGTALYFAEEPDSPHYDSPAVPFSSLMPGEAVVYSYQELKSALEENNGITTVYFGADITMQLGGVRINPLKQQVTVSGLNPLDPDRGHPYTLTDYNSSVFTNTIYIDTAGINTLIVRDMNITGKNFYGPFGVLDAGALAATSVVYRRVSYNGPQLGYHRRGTIYVEDCTVRIHGGNGGSVNQEFSEAKHLVFTGNNSIDTESSANSIFWHPLGGSFALSDDSSLTVTSPGTSPLYGVFYADGSAYKVGIDIGERAWLDMTISGAVAPDAYVSLGSFAVREAGRFTLRTTKPAAATVLRISGALTVEKEAGFFISGYGGASYSLLKQESGDIVVMTDAVFNLSSQNAYAELLNLAGRAFLCYDPANVLFYNANRAITASSGPARIYADAQQINYWDTLSQGGPEAPPASRWVKNNQSNFYIDATLPTGSGGNISGISSNWTSEDLPSAVPDAESLNMKNVRVLAFGRLELTLVTPTVKSTAISGMTKPGATVRASVLQQSGSNTFPDVTADAAGIFHIPLDVALEKDAVVTVRSDWQYLSSAAEAVVQDGSGGGRLEFFVPERMEFFLSGISPRAQIIKRLKPGWEIVVSDGRGAGGGWSLYARLNGELTPDRPDLPALEGSLVFIDGSGTGTVLCTDTDVFIASRISALDEDTSPVVWDEDKGILLYVRPGTAFTNTAYTTSIIWTLVDAP